MKPLWSRLDRWALTGPLWLPAAILCGNGIGAQFPHLGALPWYDRISVVAFIVAVLPFLIYSCLYELQHGWPWRRPEIDVGWHAIQPCGPQDGFKWICWSAGLIVAFLLVVAGISRALYR